MSNDTSSTLQGEKSEWKDDFPKTTNARLSQLEAWNVWPLARLGQVGDTINLDGLKLRTQISNH